MKIKLLHNALILTSVLFFISIYYSCDNRKSDPHFLPVKSKKQNSDSVFYSDLERKIKDRLTLDKIDSALFFASEGIRISNKNQNIKTEIKFINEKANALNIKGEFDASQKLLTETISAFENNPEFSKDICNSYYILGITYLRQQKYDKSLESYLKSIDFAKKMNDLKMVQNARANLPSLYVLMKDYDKSINEGKLLINEIIPENKADSVLYAKVLTSLSYASWAKDDPEGQRIYAEKALIINEKLHDYNAAMTTLSFLSNYYGDMMNYPKAIEIIQKTLSFSKKSQRFENVGFQYNQLVRIYSKLKDYKMAKLYADSSLMFAKKINNDLLLKYALEENIQLNSTIMNYKTALEFKNLKDSIVEAINEKERIKQARELDEKYRTTEKEAKIKEQQLQLEKEKAKRNLAIGIFVFILAGSVLGFLYFRNRQKLRNLKLNNDLLQLKQNLNLIELRALNQQLDPHEIKNLLAAISPEIQEKAPAAYRNMIKLLNLIKSTLGQQGMTESLQSQMEQAKHFLELEKLVLPVKLDYQIIDESVNKQIQIPRLLLKNMVENAVKHGIRNKPDGGEIILTVREENHFIEIGIDDNGTGRNLSISKDSGIGISTYTNLFEMLNTKNQQKAALIITDKEVGTRVDIKIPTDYNYMN